MDSSAQRSMNLADTCDDKIGRIWDWKGTRWVRGIPDIQLGGNVGGNVAGHLVGTSVVGT